MCGYGRQQYRVFGFFLRHVTEYGFFFIKLFARNRKEVTTQHETCNRKTNCLRDLLNRSEYDDGYDY